MKLKRSKHSSTSSENKQSSLKKTELTSENKQIKKELNLFKTCMIRFTNKMKEKPIVVWLGSFTKSYSTFGISDMAASTSYYMLFGLFPFLVFFILLLSGTSELLNAKLLQFSNQTSILPPNVISIINRLFKQVMKSEFKPLISIGGIALLWGCSKAFGRMLGNLKLIYGNNKIKDSYILTRISGMVFAIILGVLTIFFLMLSTLIQLFIHFIENEFLHRAIFSNGVDIRLLSNLFNFIMLSVVLYISFWILCKKKGKKKWSFFVGTGISFCWMLLSMFFSHFLVKDTKYTLLYGGFTSVMLLLLWIYLSMLVVYCGAIIHAMIIKKHVVACSK